MRLQNNSVNGAIFGTMNHVINKDILKYLD